MGKGSLPQGGSSEGSSPQQPAVKGSPLQAQPSAYKKPKHGDLAYVPPSATQKKDTQQKVQYSSPNEQAVNKSAEGLFSVVLVMRFVLYVY